MPTLQQIVGTLPPAFENIILACMPSLSAVRSTWRLQQTSTWNRPHGAVACTTTRPSFSLLVPQMAVSPLYPHCTWTLRISDIELTGVSGFLNCVQNKAGILVMADRGFAIKDMQEVGVELNSPSFMEGRQ